MKTKVISKQYFPEIDIIKGICILFIILLHSFSQFPINLRSNFPLFFQFVSSFPLCFFYIASGFVFYNRDKWSDFLKKKLTRLLLPMFVFGLTQILLRFLFAPITRSEESNSSLFVGIIKLLNGEIYWFLYCLFLINCINKIFFRWKYIIAFLFFIISLTPFSIPNIATFPNIIYFNTFFIFGFWLRKHYDYIKLNLFQRKIVLFILIIFSILFTIFEYENRYLQPFFISMTIWSITLHISNKSVLTHFGKYSLQYYLFHLLYMLPIYYVGKIIYEITNSYEIVLLVNYILAVSFSYICVNIGRKLKNFLFVKYALGL